MLEPFRYSNRLIRNSSVWGLHRLQILSITINENVNRTPGFILTSAERFFLFFLKASFLKHLRLELSNSLISSRGFVHETVRVFSKDSLQACNRTLSRPSKLESICISNLHFEFIDLNSLLIAHKLMQFHVVTISLLVEIFEHSEWEFWKRLMKQTENSKCRKLILNQTQRVWRACY